MPYAIVIEKAGTNYSAYVPPPNILYPLQRRLTAQDPAHERARRHPRL
jgi:hypothetical protein